MFGSIRIGSLDIDTAGLRSTRASGPSPRDAAPPSVSDTWVPVVRAWPDGPIDTDHYIREARSLRVQAVYGMLRRLWQFRRKVA